MTIFKKKIIKKPLDKDLLASDIMFYLENDFNCTVLFSIFDKHLTLDPEHTQHSKRWCGDIIFCRNVTRDVNITINQYSSTHTKNFQQVFVVKIADDEEEITEPDPNYILHITAFIVVSNFNQLKYRLKDFD